MRLEEGRHTRVIVGFNLRAQRSLTKGHELPSVAEQTAGVALPGVRDAVGRFAVARFWGA